MRYRRRFGRNRGYSVFSLMYILLEMCISEYMERINYKAGANNILLFKVFDEKFTSLTQIDRSDLEKFGFDPFYDLPRFF